MDVGPPTAVDMDNATASNENEMFFQVGGSDEPYYLTVFMHIQKTIAEDKTADMCKEVYHALLKRNLTRDGEGILIFNLMDNGTILPIYVRHETYKDFPMSYAFLKMTMVSVLAERQQQNPKNQFLVIAELQDGKPYRYASGSITNHDKNGAAIIAFEPEIAWATFSPLQVVTTNCKLN